MTKLESVSSRGIDQERARYQKVEELKETIRTTEDAKNHSRKEYKLVKVNHPRVVHDSSLLRCELLFISKLYNSRLL